MEKNSGSTLLSNAADARKRVAFGGFPGFACLSFRYEQLLDEGKYRTQMALKWQKKQKYVEKTQPKWHFARNKSHMDCHGIERDLGGRNLAQDILKYKVRTAQ